MAMYNLGLSALKRLVLDENGYAYFRAKLGADLFKGEGEKEVFALIDGHFQKYKTLPDMSTVLLSHPDFAEVEAPEVAKFYIDLLENRFIYDKINQGNVASQDLLKADKNNIPQAIAELEKTLGLIKQQQYRTKILDFGLEGPDLILGTYYGTLGSTALSGGFGWPYMDDMCNGILGGDVVSIVGRPAMGKTWFTLYIALHNWAGMKLNTLFVSMEMNTLAIAQRCAAMYAHTNITQLKAGVASGYGSDNQKKFHSAMQALQMEQAKLYIVDGNLAADPTDVYLLAAQLNCQLIAIDGAYLMRNKNQKLGRFDRVAENMELMKRLTSENEQSTVASWQFNRDASKKMEKKGVKAGLEDIGYSDTIGQISTIALSLMQEESVATLETRTVDVMKGRNGEIGQFDVNWQFGNMDFSQVGVKKKKKMDPLMYIE